MIETIIWKHYGDDRDDRDGHDRLDRFNFYPDDRDDREQSEAIQWKPLSDDGDDLSDPNLFLNAPVISR